MARAAFPFTIRPFTPDPTLLPLTVTTTSGGSPQDPFPIVDVSTMANRPNQLKSVEKVVLVLAAPITLSATKALALSYFSRTGTKILIRRLLSGTAATFVFTPPETGPRLGSGEFPILEAEGVDFDGVVINLAEIHLGLDR